MADMSKEAIRVRWAQHQRRSAGGWIKVPGQPDPAQDVEALLGIIDALEVLDESHTSEVRRASYEAFLKDRAARDADDDPRSMGRQPEPPKTKRKPRKRRAKATVTSTDTRTPDE